MYPHECTKGPALYEKCRRHIIHLAIHLAMQHTCTSQYMYMDILYSTARTQTFLTFKQLYFVAASVSFNVFIHRCVEDALADVCQNTSMWLRGTQP